MEHSKEGSKTINIADVIFQEIHILFQIKLLERHPSELSPSLSPTETALPKRTSTHKVLAWKTTMLMLITLLRGSLKTWLGECVMSSNHSFSRDNEMPQGITYVMLFSYIYRVT